MTDERRDKVRVRLYTRPGCHLCDEARGEMLAADVTQLFSLEEIDIDSDPELARRFGWDIPVVFIGETVAFKHRLTRDDFRREIQHALSS